MSRPAPEWAPPAELLRLRDTLALLSFAAAPAVGGSVVAFTSSGSKPGSGGLPDQARARYRSLERRMHRRLTQLADEIDAALHGDLADVPRGWRCPTDGRYQRPAACYCDRCGSPRPTEEA